MAKPITSKTAKAAPAPRKRAHYTPPEPPPLHDLKEGEVTAALNFVEEVGDRARKFFKTLSEHAGDAKRALTAERQRYHDVVKSMSEAAEQQLADQAEAHAREIADLEEQLAKAVGERDEARNFLADHKTKIGKTLGILGSVEVPKYEISK